ncbi:MAG: PLP-dependent transferase [Clostridia bacterium]|nr:PLP-dependent transferase [Clostridia bacterium]
MNTPICDFLDAYAKSDARRFHMPGHKGNGENASLDLTEIDGLDSLYCDSGVILESEQNASELFGSYNTCYSAEGASQCIKAMLHIAKMCKNPTTRGYILATRNAHSALISASILLDFDIKWIYPSESESYVSCNCSAKEIDSALSECESKPFALYVTSPDYLGNILDIGAISSVCKKHGVMLLVDNAHGAYLKFSKSLSHPLDLGADMCCDSAHKTLPALTGGAYLHIGRDFKYRDYASEYAKSTMVLYGSTSPSFLILASLDRLNALVADSELVLRQNEVENAVLALKKSLHVYGFEVLGDETLKITINASAYGYTGIELAKLLRDKGIFVEFFDVDFVVMMLSCNTPLSDITYLEDTLKKIPKKETITRPALPVCKPEPVMSTRNACFLQKERVRANNSLGRVLASSMVSCPPAVSIVVCGERIDKNAIALFKYYGTEFVYVIKE